jgi:hypothetical protein
MTSNPILIVFDQVEVNPGDEPGWICYESIELTDFYLAQMFVKMAQPWERMLDQIISPNPLFY